MDKAKKIASSLVNSYSQIFFSDNHVLGVVLLMVTFFNINAGISGIIAIVVSNTAALLMGLNRAKIISGLYGFNALLVGLGLGVYYNFSPAFLLF